MSHRGKTDSVPMTPAFEDALRRADPGAHRDLAAMARGERLVCMVHPGRVAIAEIENTGEGLCRDCYRKLMNDPESYWAMARSPR